MMAYGVIVVGDVSEFGCRQRRVSGGIFPSTVNALF
jgi:hypothetical protein